MHSIGEEIRVRGLVQGVGFRPTVWRIAHELGLAGEVRNDGEGVLIRVWGDAERRDVFCARLVAECPPLARIAALERMPAAGGPAGEDFRIVASARGEVRTAVVPDAATCGACRAEVADPADRRHRYAFTNCTHCGPRLSIVRAIPYDRANTSMAPFAMCAACAREYADPGDRRFHAQPNACPACGPTCWIEDAHGRRIDPRDGDARDAPALASRLLDQGAIVAVKGIGGFHLACDATDEAAVARLRERKRRYRKPFALMARDLPVVRAYCHVSDEEAALLVGSAAPVVLLDAHGGRRVAPSVAPGQRTLGFMLPYSPLHQLLLAGWDRPLVMTSGNLSEEPQCIGNADAEDRLRPLADFFLLHDRDIVNRVDDSVVRWMDGGPRLLRRARGYAPSPLPLPDAFAAAPPILALGGELKSTFCVLEHGLAVLSQHLGDLEDARTFAEYERTVALYLELFAHRPQRLVVDAHPEYRATRFGRAWAKREGLPVDTVQHHHAHVAAVLAENGWLPDRGRVLGVVLDGLGYGADGTLWGGEFLAADYTQCTRLAHLAPTAMPGGVRSILEPWRNTVAQLAAHVGWDAFRRDFGDLPLADALAGKPVGALLAMIRRGINSPLASSCGRLFDAVAAAADVCPDRVSYEGEAAIALEAALEEDWASVASPYPLRVEAEATPWQVSPAPLWPALLADLRAGTSLAVVAARFHAGLAQVVSDVAAQLAAAHRLPAVALSGGVFQNRALFERTAALLRARGVAVLGHRLVPANDGGISLGQAAICAMRNRIAGSTAD